MNEFGPGPFEIDIWVQVRIPSPLTLKPRLLHQLLDLSIHVDAICLIHFLDVRHELQFERADDVGCATGRGFSPSQAINWK